MLTHRYDEAKEEAERTGFEDYELAKPDSRVALKDFEF
jgi:hypothetical protein